MLLFVIVVVCFRCCLCLLTLSLYECVGGCVCGCRCVCLLTLVFMLVVGVAYCRCYLSLSFGCVVAVGGVVVRVCCCC